jgi:hypothetical protein
MLHIVKRLPVGVQRVLLALSVIGLCIGVFLLLR